MNGGGSFPLCIVIPKGSNDMSECQAACTKRKCGALNVVPFHKPSTSLFGDPLIPTLCKNHPNVKDVKEGDRLCYALMEGRPNDSGSAYDLTSDPEDPVFYSTCYKRQSSAEVTFSGNTCGAPCQLAEASVRPVWRYGDRCVSCDAAARNVPGNRSFLPTWSLQDKDACMECSSS